jgi:hypothetical protein
MKGNLCTTGAPGTASAGGDGFSQRAGTVPGAPNTPKTGFTEALKGNSNVC